MLTQVSIPQAWCSTGSCRTRNDNVNTSCIKPYLPIKSKLILIYLRTSHFFCLRNSKKPWRFFGGYGSLAEYNDWCHITMDPDIEPGVPSTEWRRKHRWHSQDNMSMSIKPVIKDTHAIDVDKSQTHGYIKLPDAWQSFPLSRDRRIWKQPSIKRRWSSGTLPIQWSIPWEYMPQPPSLWGDDGASETSIAPPPSRQHYWNPTYAYCNPTVNPPVTYPYHSHMCISNKAWTSRCMTRRSP